MRRLLAPRMLGAHLLMVVAVVAAGGLGLWQLDAWQSRRHAEALDLTHQTPVRLDDVMGSDDPFPAPQLGAPVLVEGSWVADATVYVSGRQHDGQPGYWVVTPLSSGAPDSPAIPVVRGWTPSPAQAPSVPTGPARLVGWLQPSDSSEDVDTDPTDDVVPSLQVADLVQRVHQDLYSGYVVDADATETAAWPDGATPLNDGTSGLAPADLTQLPQASTFTAIRNLFYAIEWWFFGGFAAFVWWRFLRDERIRLDAEAKEEAGDGAPQEPAPVVSTLEA